MAGGHGDTHDLAAQLGTGEPVHLVRHTDNLLGGAGTRRTRKVCPFPSKEKTLVASYHTVRPKHCRWTVVGSMLPVAGANGPLERLGASILAVQAHALVEVRASAGALVASGRL